MVMLVDKATQKFGLMIEEYLVNRPNLKEYLCLLMEE